MSKPIWRWFDDDYRAHVDSELYHQLMRWDGVTHGSTYTYPDKYKEYDIQFPSDLLPRVKQTLRKAETLKSMSKPTNPAKGRNDLRGAKSPS